MYAPLNIQYIILPLIKQKYTGLIRVDTKFYEMPLWHCTLPLYEHRSIKGKKKSAWKDSNDDMDCKSDDGCITQRQYAEYKTSLLLGQTKQKNKKKQKKSNSLYIKHHFQERAASFV